MKLQRHIIAYSITALLFWSCSKKENTEEKESHHDDQTIVTLNEHQFKTAGIETGKIELREQTEVVKANGVLDVPPQNMVSVSAPLGGFVKSTELLQGMRVKKGQTLVIMEHPEYIQLQQDYLEAKSQFAFIEAEYARQEVLANDNVNAAKTFQQAKANYQSTKAKVEGLSAKLKLAFINPQQIENGNIQSTISIPSPIEGFVTEINVNLGSYVNPIDMMFEIIDTEHLHAEAEVFERDILRLKKGQKVSIRLVNENNEREATIYLIGKEISPERTVRIHCHLEKEDANLLPGMYFTAIIETGSKKVNSLPEESFTSYEGKDYVFTVIDKEKQEYKMEPVTKGECEGGYCEISFIEKVDPSVVEVVIKGAFDLLSQLKNTGEDEH
jgi:membrane fusion protein, heavy metal efflux system